MLINRLVIKHQILDSLYKRPQINLSVEISKLVIKNAIINDVINDAAFHYTFYHGKKYYSKEAGLNELSNNLDISYKGTSLDHSIRDEFAKLVENKKELKAEQELVMAYITQTLNLCVYERDVIALLPSVLHPIMKVKNKGALKINKSTQANHHINKDKYNRILKERIMINLLLKEN